MRSSTNPTLQYPAVPECSEMPLRDPSSKCSSLSVSHCTPSYWIPHLYALGSFGFLDFKIDSRTRLYCTQWRCASWTSDPTCSCDLDPHGHMRQPKVHRWFRFTSLSVHASSGIPHIKYTAVLTASVQNCLDNSVCIRMLLTCSRIVLFMRSATRLMRVFRNRLHSTNSPTRAELFKSAITVFAPIVALQALKLSTWFVLNLGQSFLKHIKTHLTCALRNRSRLLC